MKIGRNQLCWCGSGKKYKKCHLDREEQSKTPLSEGIAALQRKPEKIFCNCPEELNQQCSGPPINSHSLAKSLGLRAISEQGHVFGLKHDFQTLKKNKGKAEIGLIGINKISVFPGFCAYHDSSLFKEIETDTFTATPKQCALLSYRAIARERYTKMLGIDVNEFLKGSDRGRSISEQIAIQQFLASYGAGLVLAGDDLDRAMAEHHASILSNDFSNFQSLVLEFADFPVLCTTGHMPSEDWSGATVQDLSGASLEADWVSAVSFHSGKSAWVVFTWLRKSEKVRKFVNSLETQCINNIADALIKYFFSVSENIAVNPQWWKSLSEHEKNALNLRIQDGLPISLSQNVMAPRTDEPTVSNVPVVSSIYV